MIDIHNHILVNLDDGPESENDMISLLKQANSQGIKGIVATPHHLHPKYRNNDARKVMRGLKKLQNDKEVKKLNMQLYPGQEVRLSDEIIDGLKNGSVIGLNHSKYILIELPSSTVPSYTKRLFFEIQQLGFIPVIAHPERNKAIAKNPMLLYELVQNGALSQLTAGALLGGFGKKVRKLSLQLLDCHLAHAVASDAHSVGLRPFQLQDVLNNSSLKKERDKIQCLINNGYKMVNNIDITLTKPLNPTPRKKFLGLF